MTLIEIKDYPRDIKWIDGFLPSVDSILNRNGNINDLLNPLSNDQLLNEYLRVFINTIKHNWQQNNSLSQIYPYDVFLLRPAIKSKANPVTIEYNCLPKNLKRTYVLLCMISLDDELNKIKNEDILYTLAELNFRIKKETSYKNVKQFKQYIHELSDIIVEPYYAPALRVCHDLKKHGLSTQDNAMF